ncbi:substrate-binding domain-containing protein [Bacillus sonorensis]|nr:substrate-binding domain-containing protein [Bacillus sonorensis]
MTNSKLSYKGTELFIQKGHHLMAFCCDTIHSKAQIMRKEGFMKALSDAGLHFQEKWMFSHAFTIHDGFRIMDQIHSMSEKPTAIFTGNDQVAAGIIKRPDIINMKCQSSLQCLDMTINRSVR